MIKFLSTIVERDSTQHRMPLLWQWTESYTNVFSAKEYKISHIDPTTLKYVLEENLLEKKDSFIFTLIKVLSYATIILPALAYGIRSYYRRSHRYVEYSFSEQIAKINRSIDSGLSIGLCWGQYDNEPLPIQDGFVWVSLHEEMINEPKDGHIHLRIDLKSQITFSSPLKDNFRKKFQRILITGEKFKELENPVDSLISMLTPNSKIGMEKLEINIPTLHMKFFPSDDLKSNTIYDVDKMEIHSPSTPREDLLKEWGNRLVNLRGKGFQEKFNKVIYIAYNDDNGVSQIGYRLIGIKKTIAQQIAKDSKLRKG